MNFASDDPFKRKLHLRCFTQPALIYKPATLKDLVPKHISGKHRLCRLVSKDNLCKIPIVTHTHTHTPDRGVVIRPDHHGYYEEQASAQKTEALRTLISINMRRVDRELIWTRDQTSLQRLCRQNQHRRIQPKTPKHRRLYQPSILRFAKIQES